MLYCPGNKFLLLTAYRQCIELLKPFTEKNEMKRLALIGILIYHA